MVLTDDRAGLLADIAAALSANRIEITAAQIFSRARSEAGAEAVDLLHVRPSKHTGEPLTGDETRRVARDIEDVLLGRVSAEMLLARSPKQPAWARRKGPDVRTKIVIDNHVSPRFSVVDVYAHDHVGLLYTIAQTLRAEGLSIALSKVNTEGLKAADVFYVSRHGGGKLDAEQSELLRQKLLDAIEASRERDF
jgi:[protein-PII] uridylyltransferase